MTNTKWLRRALLGGVALGAMATGAQADELDALKAQLATLQARVNQLEAKPAMPALPEGASLITFHRGSEAMADWKTDRVTEGGVLPADRGFTVAITPAADMPAPVTVVTIGGYVKGDVIYDVDQDLGDFFSFSRITDEAQTENHVRLHAKQSRFNIKSKTDTAVGQIRTLIELDFFAGSRFGPDTPEPRMRHAVGEWDFYPNWTFLAGQTWRTNLPLFAGITTVDFNGPAGLIGTSRVAQVRLQYKDGPWTFAAAIENPTCEGRAKDSNDCFVVVDNDANTDETSSYPSNKIPDIAAKVQFDAPGGHMFHLGGTVRFFNTDADVSENIATELEEPEVSEQATGWVVTAAANFNIMDAATLSLLATYGDGAGDYILGLGNPAAWQESEGDVHTIEGLGLFAGLTVPFTDVWSFNAGVGYADPQNDDVKDCIEADACTEIFLPNGNGFATHRLYTVHANAIWRPVKQLQMGWEVMWAKRHMLVEDGDGSFEKEKEDALRFQYGVWFYF